MSMQSLEREILAELKLVTNNPKLKMKDILEWSTGKNEACSGEKIFYLSELGVYCAIKA